MGNDFKSPQELERRQGAAQGISGDAADEVLHENRNKHELQPVVKRNGNDYVIENRHNASIVLGRDYEYDDLNDTSVGMVDLTAGRIADHEKSGFKRTLTAGESSGDMIADAAKVYISQKTDIDALYGFTVTDPATNRSAVGIKADAIRLVSRDPGGAIKLIVQPDSIGPTAGKNSQGGGASGINNGVHLIGPGKEPSQPLVRSDDLAKSLAKLVGYIEQLEIMVWDFVSYQKKFNSAVSQATDIEAFYAQKGIPDPLLVKANAKCSLDLFSYVENSGKSIRAELEKYVNNDLGITSDESGNKKTGKAVFSSKYHKLN